jgi:hypothetical protein
MMKRVGMIFTKIAHVQQYFVQISYTEFQREFDPNYEIRKLRTGKILRPQLKKRYGFHNTDCCATVRQ